MQTGIVVGRSRTLTISSTCKAAILLMFFEITVRVCETNNLSAKYLFAMYTDGKGRLKSGSLYQSTSCLLRRIWKLETRGRYS